MTVMLPDITLYISHEWELNLAVSLPCCITHFFRLHEATGTCLYRLYPRATAYWNCKPHRYGAKVHGLIARLFRETPIITFITSFLYHSTSTSNPNNLPHPASALLNSRQWQCLPPRNTQLAGPQLPHPAAVPAPSVGNCSEQRHTSGGRGSPRFGPVVSSHHGQRAGSSSGSHRDGRHGLPQQRW